eukprot:4927679-Amphidinium_carterae.1
MALFPNETETAAFRALREIRTWVGLGAPAFDAFQTVVGDFEDKIRNLALLQANHVRMAVESARVQSSGGDSRPLSVVESSQVGLVWRIAKRVSMLAAGTPFADIDVEDPLCVTEKREPPADEPAVGSGAGHILKKLKMANIIDQTDDSELTSGKVDASEWIRNYTDLMKAAPLPEEEPSTDQLVALHHRVLMAHATPYVDFGIWGPFQRKTLRASKFRSWSLGPQGTYISKELPGTSGCLLGVYSPRHV